MNKRRLGSTDLYLTELGYGCASLWGKANFTSDEEAERLFFSAYEHGIHFYDTSYSYGVAEERLGHYMKKLVRQDLVISTKCGTRRSKSGKYYHDWSVEWMQRSLETSMNRLHTDYIDMFQVHGPKVDEISDAMLRWLNGLKEAGVVRAIGINTFDTDVVEYVNKYKLFDFVMLDYNMLRQDRETLIAKLHDNGIGVVAGAPLAQSLYSNRVYKVKNLKDVWYFCRALKNFRGHMVEGRRFQFVNKVEGMTGNQVALRYVLDNKRITSAVFGTVNQEHLVENIGGADIVIPGEVKKKIRARGRKHAGRLDRR